ncbi:MAG: histidine--tRNA ligase [Acidobacteriota bacterium]
MAKKSTKVKPRISRGLRDLMPGQVLARQWMVERIRGVYERYGFLPLETPAIEYLDVLFGSEAGEEANKQIFRVSNPENEELGLRFDLTVPLARVVAKYAQELGMPFRRYQVAQVWRGDKPDPGRFREFMQFDLDSVGVPSEIADTEVIAGICDTLEALEVPRYRVRYSSRAILEVLVRWAGLPDSAGKDVFRVLDKLDKAGLEKVKLELTTGYKDDSGDVIKGLGLESSQVEKIARFLAIGAEERTTAIEAVTELFGDTDGAAEAIAPVASISRHLAALGYGDDRVAFDVSIARGLGYYTGPVFEANLLDAPQFGSVFSGGRYDGLVARFSGQAIPAVGASIGVDRLLAALEHLGLVKTRKSTAQVLVTVFDKAMMDEYLALTWELRREGINAELFLGSSKNMGKQLKYADRREIPVALLFGPDEKEQGIVQLKDMDVGRRTTEEIENREAWLEARPGQRDVPRDELIPTLKALLAQIEAS